MASKVTLFGIALCCMHTATFNQSSAQEHNTSFNKSAFSNYISLPANKAASSATIKSVKTHFPGWVVTTDKLDGMFTDVYGSPITLPGNNNIDNAQYCMAQKLSDLGVQKNEWKKVSDIDARKAAYVNYTREIDGHPVVFSRLSFRFTKTGELARIQMKNYGKPGKASLALTANDAKKVATDDLSGSKDITITNTDVLPTWSWFPVPAATGYDLHPAWQFMVSGKASNGVPLKLKGFVDATNGRILYRTNEVKETGYDLTVKGVVYTDGISNPTSVEALPDLELHIGASVYYTDAVGFFANPGLLLPLSTTIPLQGKWSQVFNDPTNTTPSFVNLVSLGGTTYTYPTTAPSSSRHINAYYHVGKVHNFMKLHLPTFTGMDFTLPTYVDVSGGYCNAYYTGSDINFFAAGGGCVSFANMGDVVYHEYGHGISDMFYTWVTGTSIWNGALNEANSDIWGLGITHNPVLAKDAFTTYGGFIRRYDKIPQVYPMDIGGEVHKDGMIIAGCWWDVGVNIGSIDTMSWLFTDVYYDVPDGPDGTEGTVYQTILIDALMADDNDANILNGTPHYNQIVAAFAKHGIYLEGDVFFTHPEISIQPAGTPIPVTASLGMTTTTYFNTLTLYYRINNTGAWSNVALTKSGFSFSGTIPAQPQGTTVEYYFVALDNLNQPNAYFPVTCNPTLPDYYASIPYQFGVGIGAVTTNNFDGATIDWGIGSNPGDNATGGLWKQDYPFGTNNMWPNGDHTGGSTASGMCLFTGDENDTTGVRRGASTVLSPVFDISGFTTPVIEYYRWFSNEYGNRNFKNDPWIVKIRDGSASTWQTVENTYQGDLNWRRRIFPVHTYLPAAASIQVKFFASDSLVSTLASNGQSKTVTAMDDFSIYDQASVSVKDNTIPKASVFPSPADDKVQIVLTTEANGTIGLYNMAGQLITQVKMEQNKKTYSINTKEFAAGQYSLVIQTDKSIQSKKIVIMHR